jgi:hypothetical protein
MILFNSHASESVIGLQLKVRAGVVIVSALGNVELKARVLAQANTQTRARNIQTQ